MSTPSVSLPTNVHVSNHPCIKAKLSQLRNSQLDARNFKDVIQQAATMIAYEALGATLHSAVAGTSPLGDDYEVQSINPSHINLVPILRSGLSMVDSVVSLLPFSVPVNHLGLYRDRSLHPVEYYNNLSDHDGKPVDLAIILDPVIATGVTCLGAVESLKEYGAKKIVIISILGSATGVRKVAESSPDVDIWLGGCDPATDAKGMIRPGLGDVGDRLFLTHGK